MTETETPPVRGRVLRILAGVAVAAVALLAALWFARALVIERVLTAALTNRLGIEVGLAVERAGLDGTTLAGVQLGADSAVAIDRVELRYDFTEVLQGRVRDIAVIGLTANARVGPDGVSLGSLDKMLAAPGDGDTTLPALPAIRFQNSTVNVTSPVGLVTAHADGTLGPKDDGGLALQSTLSLSAEQGRVDGTLTLAYGSDGAVDGDLTFGPGDLRGADGLHLRGLSGRIAFAGADGAAPPRANAALSADAIELPDLALGPAKGTLDFDGERLRLDGSLSAADGRAEAALRAQFTPLTEPMALDAEATVSLRPDAGLWGLLPLPPETRITGPAEATLSLALEGAPDALAGDTRLTVTVAGAEMPAVAIGTTVLVLPGVLALNRSTAAFTPAAGGVLRLDKIDVQADDASRLTIAEPLTIPVEPTETARLEATRGDAGVHLRHDITLGPAAISATLVSAGARQTLAGQIPRLRLDGAVVGKSYAGRIIASDGALTLSKWALRLGDIAGEVQLGPAPSEQTVLAHLSIGRIEHSAALPYVVPLRLDARLERKGAEQHLSGSLADASGRLSAAFAGRHDPATGTGEASIDLKRLAFGVGIAGPGTLFPILKGLVRNSAGEFGMRGGLTWDKSGLASQGEILIEGASAEFGAIALRQLNTVLAFDSRAGKRKPKRQEIAIGALDIGVPLTDGRVALRIEPRGRLLIEEMRWTLAGGRVFAKDFAVDPRTDRHRILLEVEGVEFAKLLAVFQLEGVEATGALSGRIPVEIIGEDALIEKGELATATPGALRYKPAQVPAALQSGGEGMKLALRALEDFRYDSLRMTLNRQLGGETLVTLHLKGRNPNLYDGYPIALNLTLSGALDRILQDSLSGYRVPDKIRQRMLDFSR